MRPLEPKRSRTDGQKLSGTWNRTGSDKGFTVEDDGHSAKEALPPMDPYVYLCSFPRVPSVTLEGTGTVVQTVCDEENETKNRYRLKEGSGSRGSCHDPYVPGDRHEQHLCDRCTGRGVDTSPGESGRPVPPISTLRTKPQCQFVLVCFTRDSEDGRDSEVLRINEELIKKELIIVWFITSLSVRLLDLLQLDK